jgi:hypothetical protein
MTAEGHLKMSSKQQFRGRLGTEETLNGSARDRRTGGTHVASNNPGGDETCTPTEIRARRTPSLRVARDPFQCQ